MKYGSAVILTLLFPVVAFADVYIYPNKGQSQQKQTCFDSAGKESGTRFALSLEREHPVEVNKVTSVK